MKTLLRNGIEISDEADAALRHIVVCPETWVRDLLQSKISSTIKEMVTEAQTTLRNDPELETMPATDSGLIAALMARPGYKTRAERDAEFFGGMSARLRPPPPTPAPEAMDPTPLSQMAAPSDDMLFDEEGVPVDVAELRGEEEDISTFKSRLADDLTRLRNLNQMSAQGTYTMTEADRTMLRRLEGRAAEFWFRN